MRLHLRQRHDQIRAQRRIRQINFAAVGKAHDRADVVAIQIHEQRIELRNLDR